MINKIQAFIAFFAILSISSFGQSSDFYRDFDLDEALPNADTLVLSDTSEVTLKNRIYYEYFFDKEYDGNLVEAAMIHRQTLVKSNSAIESNNKLYIPVSDVLEVVETKARVINPNGEVIEKDENDILETEEDGEKYQYFAFDGIERGAIIEYMYIVKRNPSVNGKSFTLDSDHMKYNVEYKVISPENLIFVANTYNLPDFVSDTTFEDHNVITLFLDSIKPFDSEPYSNSTRHRAKFRYKLDEVTNRGLRNYVSYAEVGKIVYSNCFKPENKKEAKAVKKFISKHNLDEIEGSAEDRIREIEDIVRSEVFLSSQSSFNIQEILKAGYADELGMVRLFVEVFRQLDIDFRVVVTTSRYSFPFDKDFETYSGLSDYLFYFPEIEKYFAAGDLTSRLGFIPQSNFNNYGIFVEEIEFGGGLTSVMQIDTILPPPADLSLNQIYMEVSFNDDLTSNHFNVRLSEEGYYAKNVQPILNLISDEEQREEIVEEMLTNLVSDAEFEDIEVQNDGMNDFGRKPLIIRGKTTSPDMINRAGDKILFKVGQLIGPQNELYSEDERKYPIENGFNQNYKRELRIDIPEGYNVTNLDDLIINEVYGFDGAEDVIGFVSNYRVENGTIIIEIQEYYRELMFPKSYFPKFQKVINAAADFNKIVLIFEKQS